MADAQGRVVVVGAKGRMGTRLVRALVDHPSLGLASGVDRGDDIARALSGSDVVIDFSAPAATAEVAPLCAKAGVAYVVASTALSAEAASALEDAAKHVPVLRAANFSIGVNVLAELVAEASARLAGFDIEISEIHHKHKRDAPSGTALALGAAVARGRPGLRDVHNRTEMRADDELGFAALRGGDVAGDHTVYYFGPGERLELTHRANSADVFAHGALTAARWLIGRAPGVYLMRDVLGFAKE
jgi:4-hydroxy-tetrahydrodipicolinate reductase